MPTRTRAHTIGLTAAALGLASVTLLPFATFRASRIQTGDPLSALDALGPWGLAALVAVWLAVAALSLGGVPRVPAAALRGALGTLALLGTVALSAVAVARAADAAMPFARVSLGTGAWACIAISYSLVLASRREDGLPRLVRAALSLAAPLGIVAMLATGTLDDLAIIREYASQSDRFWAEVVAQLRFSGIAVAVALALGIALGTLAFRRPRFRGPIFAVANVFQTIPGLAMVGLLFAPLSWLGSSVPFFGRLGVGGLGWAPVITALTLYALLAIVRNTYAGLASVPTAAVDAGLGMGMTEWQVTRRVRFPLAMPVIFGGVRTAAVQTLGNATLGAFVAAGTLGLFVFGGLSQQAMDLILLGSVALVLLALALDGVLRTLQGLISPRHLRGREGAPR